MWAGLEGEVGVGGRRRAEQGGELSEEGEGEQDEERCDLKPARLGRLGSLPRLPRLRSSLLHAGPIELRPELTPTTPEARTAALPEEELEEVFGRELFASASVESASSKRRGHPSSASAAASTTAASRVWIAPGLVKDGPLVAVREDLERF